MQKRCSWGSGSSTLIQHWEALSCRQHLRTVPDRLTGSTNGNGNPGKWRRQKFLFWLSKTGSGIIHTTLVVSVPIRSLGELGYDSITRKSPCGLSNFFLLVDWATLGIAWVSFSGQSFDLFIPEPLSERDTEASLRPVFSASYLLSSSLGRRFQFRAKCSIHRPEGDEYTWHRATRSQLMLRS